MKDGLLHDEKIYYCIIMIVLLLWAVAFFAFDIFNLSSGPFEIILGAAIFLVASNFLFYRIRLDREYLTVSFGIFNKRIPVENILDVYTDDVSALLRYGGYGIRIGRVPGRWRLVYNTFGAQRLVLVREKAQFPEFVFSTRHPDELTKKIKSLLNGVE